MYRMMLCAAAAMLIAGTVEGALADDRSVCEGGIGDKAVAACTRLLTVNPKAAAVYNNRGYAYNGNGDYDHAIADLDEAIRLDPRNAAAYNNRGFAYYGERAYDRAITEFDQAIRLDPKFALAYANRGKSYARKGDDDRAIADYDQAIRLDPTYATAYNDRGKAYARKGDYERATADLDEAIWLAPKVARAYSNRGELFEMRGDPDLALADFEDALKLNPGEDGARRGRERVQAALANHSTPSAPATPSSAPPVPSAGPSADFRQCRNLSNKDLAQRVEACTRAIEAAGATPDVLLPAHRTRMALYAQLAQLDRMLPDCDEVIRLAPDDPPSAAAYGLRGLERARRHELGRAIADLDKAIALDPSQSNFYFTRANAQLKMANYLQARADIDKAISIKPDFTLGYWLKGQYHLELGDDVGALADATEGLQHDPQDTYCLALRAEYHLRAGKLAEAQADADRAVASGPQYAGAYAVRGRIALAQGRTEAAVSDLTQAVDHDEDKQPAPVAYRGMAHERAGNSDLAATDYRHALELTADSKADRDAQAMARQHLAGLAQAQPAAPAAPAAAAAPPVEAAGPSADRGECRNLDDKDLTRRVEACTRAIAASSGNPDVALSLHRKRMALYAQLGQLDRAIPDCDEVIRLAPDDAETAFAYGLRGLALVARHESGPAIADLDKAIMLDPSQVNFYFARANAHLTLAHYPQARADIDKMISLNPDFVLGYWLRGQYHLELDDDAGVLADTNEGLRRDPQDAYCSALRAEYYLRAGSLTEAQADADRAVASGPHYAGAYGVRGRIALAQGRTEAAVSDLTKAIEQDEDKQPEPVAYRGMALERAGNTDLATADYRHALELKSDTRMNRDAQTMAQRRLAALASR